MKTTIIDPSVLAGVQPTSQPAVLPVGKPMPFTLGPTIATGPMPTVPATMPGGPSTQPSQYSTQGPIPKG